MDKQGRRVDPLEVHDAVIISDRWRGTASHTTTCFMSARHCFRLHLLLHLYWTAAQADTVRRLSIKYWYLFFTLQVSALTVTSVHP